MSPAPSDCEYHEINYECRWCGAAGHALGHKECGVDWLEKLHALLTCNRCADKLDMKRTILEDLRGVIYKLETGTEVTRTGVRPITNDERIDMGRDKAILQRRLREVIGELNTLKKHESRTPADTGVLPVVQSEPEYEGGPEQSAPESLQSPV